MGLQDREYMHEKHRNQATTNRYLHPNLKSLKFRRSYKSLISATIYCLIAVLLVLSYLQAPTVTIANKKLKCTFETLKLDVNGDGVFSIKDIGQLSLKGFSLPVKYVNSNSTLSPIVDFFEIKQQCDGSVAIALNGILWLLLYLGVLEAVRFLTNVSQLVLKTLLFDLLKIKTSTSLLFSIYRAVHPRWDFAVNIRYPLLLLGGLTVISLLAIRPETPPTVSKNTNIPTTAAALDLAPTRPAAPKSVSNQSVSTASVAPIPSSSEKKVSVPPKLLTQGEENQKKTEQYQGQPQTKEQILAAAKENAKPTSNECPSGGIGSKSEDIKSYVERQEGLQIRISAAIERLYRKEVEGNAAIAQFNSFIDESNQLIIWGRGKVTDEGVCNRPEITQRISKSYRTTEYLLKIYKQSL